MAGDGKTQLHETVIHKAERYHVRCACGFDVDANDFGEAVRFANEHVEVPAVVNGADVYLREVRKHPGVLDLARNVVVQSERGTGFHWSTVELRMAKLLVDIDEGFRAAYTNDQ